MQEEELLGWRAPSRPFKSKKERTLTVPVVIAILVGIVLLLAGEWMLIVVVGALIFAYYTWSTVPPEEAQFSLTSRGVRAHGNLFLWEDLTRWWWDEKWDQKILVVETPLVMAGRVFLPVGKVESDKIEKVMNKHLLYEKPLETGVDKASRWISEKFPLTEEKN